MTTSSGIFNAAIQRIIAEFQAGVDEALGNLIIDELSTPHQEHHESDDGEDQEDRPQHDQGDTPRFDPVHATVAEYGGGQFKAWVAADTQSYPSGDIVVVSLAWWQKHAPPCPSVFGNEDAYACELTAGHDGDHRETGAGWQVTWRVG